jgi:pyridoxamine 5'-phosphate oxidase
MTEPLQAVLQQVWNWLESGPKLCTLATVNLSGGAEARTLMSRAVSAASAEITLNTDALTPKVAEIQANPLGSILFYDRLLDWQIRLRCHFVLREGTLAEWENLPESQPQNYGTVPSPGTLIASAEEYTRIPNPARFAIITGKIQQIDYVDLTPPVHHRALFIAPDWQGQWLAP